DASRGVIAWNESPDVPFDRSINPYRGCEHGCIYCFARPTHAWLDYSPGLDFETKIVYKADAPSLLKKALEKKSYVCQPIALGVNTDAYQPAERHLNITRSVLQVLDRSHHPVGIVTKSALIERDLDILASLAERRLCHVMISLTTLDKTLARRMEPRAAAPHRRLRTIERLRAGGIPVGVMVAPVIPALNDQELETLLETARNAGAMDAGYVIIRLPLEVKTLFKVWLDEHYPLKAERIMNRIRDLRGGKEYDARFGKRMSGEGVYAQLIKKRFDAAVKKYGFPGLPSFDTTAFRPDTPQMDLFRSSGVVDSATDPWLD
ncbi:MAG TPA: PA0069 family radical SAM protein, partial [Gammaproteobacteria bacterium]|nr:PA0069 family radical SAM protein [Gammaproteobacteria bacterium]